jgi:hypothetical protein
MGSLSAIRVTSHRILFDFKLLSPFNINSLCCGGSLKYLSWLAVELGLFDSFVRLDSDCSVLIVLEFGLGHVDDIEEDGESCDIFAVV